MSDQHRIGVVIPAWNEEASIAFVIADIPAIVGEIVVVDNGSTDATAERARAAGATVLHQPLRGYGHACQMGVDYLAEHGYDIAVFLDGDYADHPEELTMLVRPLLDGHADFVLGSRTVGEREPGALLPQAFAGNLIAGAFITLFWGYRFTDLGPFRAIRIDALQAMRMREFRYGWTVEMQIKAAKMKLRVRELPVRYRKRIGTSKVTGTFSGTARASLRILYTLFRHLFSSR